MDKIDWCFSIKGGLKKIEPSERIALSYLTEAERSLSKVQRCIDEGDFLWASVRIYYCSYYSLYALLQRIGIKSENHDCSIELVDKLIGKNIKEKMKLFKECRIDAQYFLKVGQRNKLLKFYSDVKNFYLELNDFVKNITKEDVKEFRGKVR